MNRVRIAGRPAWPLALLLLLVAAALAVVLLLRSDGGSDHGRQLALAGAAARKAAAKGGEHEAGSRRGPGETNGREKDGGEEADREAAAAETDKKKAAPEIKGGNGGEGARHGARTPWGEQVGNRAYPRTYVDDRIARRVQRNFSRVPARSSRSSFRSSGAFSRAVAAAPASWAQIGPVTPNVAGEASQFLDPVTGKGPATQESGRQTAIQVDPNCVPGNCRVWVAAAGGGIWRTPDALAATPQWRAPDSALKTNSFGSLLYVGGNTLYAGSGEPNGSGDSEAGLGLFKSTDGGVSWNVVPGSEDVATNRSIGAIAIDPADPNTIYIGTAVARHGSSSVNGGRRTPPDAPQLGVYKSTDGGETFDLQQDLSDKTPQNPTDPAAGTGSDWFQGGINKMEFDPNDPGALYAAVLGYGIWRTTDGGTTWEQVFHTMNQTNFDDPDNSGDTFGDRTEFELVDLGATTRAYVGDSSDDGFPPDFVPQARVYRNNAVGAITGDPDGAFDNTGTWTELSNDQNGTNGYAAYQWCQNAQCGYDAFVTSPPGHPDEVWLGGSMNYDELPAYAGQPPRSNGRGVIRTTNGGAATPSVTWQDMTVQLGSNDDPWDPKAGLHPDQHAVGFSQDGKVAFVSSDGGLARIDVGSPEDHSASCDNRRYVYEDGDGTPEPLRADDKFDCKELLSAIPNKVGPLNDGLADLQFQSLSYNPKNAGGELLGGTQDNGTWSFTGTPRWFESVGGDGGQSGFNAASPTVRFHNYYDATPEVNFHGNDPTTWLNIYDRLQETGEARSFYTPFIADPVVGGRLFTGLEHVWRAEDNGGKESDLATDCNALRLNPDRSECGNWVPIGQNLTGGFGGDRAGQFVVATERSLSDKGTLWAATRTGRVFISKNADAKPNQVKFTRLDDDAGTPERFVSGISIDTANPNHAWVSYSGYSAYTPSTPGHVFEVTYDPATHDSTWVDQSNNLRDEPVTDIALNGATGDVYASTDFGVLRLPKGSDTWTEAAENMPAVSVFGITLAECDGLLYAATHGRSAYVLKLPKNNGAPCRQPGGGHGGPGGPTPPPAGGAKPDTTKPKLTVRKIKRVRRPAKSIVKGRATDASGIRKVVVRWGDGRRTKAKVSGTGRFTVRHHYRSARRFTLHVKATDKAGNSRTKKVHARVLKKRQAGA